MFDPSHIDEQKEAGDFPASDVAALLPLACNVSDEVLGSNVEKMIARGLPLLEPREPHDDVALIVGGGPSAEDDLPLIRALVDDGAHAFALNGAGQWLMRNGIKPHAVILLDARPHNAKFVAGLPQETIIYIATQCDQSVCDAAAGHPIVVWHVPLGPGFDELLDRPTVMIGGGTSTGIRAMRLLHVIGYRTEHLFGYDSSYRDGDAHAYDQPENAGDVPREAVCGGRAFVSTGWMIRQADDFQHIAHGLMLEGMNIHMHGDGLLPEVARQMNRG